MRYILGFSDSVHDRSVCLTRGSEPVCAIEEERLSRVKHGLPLYEQSRTDPSVFSQLNLERSPASVNQRRLQESIDYCLSTGGISAADVDILIGNSLHLAAPFHDCAVYLNHHVAHACSSFFASPFAEAAVLVADGYGDPVDDHTYETVFLGHGVDRRISCHRVVAGRVTSYYDMENSLGVFYRIGTLLAGFGVFDEGKAMGLAGHGRPRFRDLVCRHVSFREGEVLLDNRGLWECLTARFPDRSDFELRADLVASFQQVLNEGLLHYARYLHQVTRSPRLCVAGGVGLNCVANAYLLEHSPYRELFVCPAPGDNGVSLGACYFAAHYLLGLPRGPALRSSGLGRSYSIDRIRRAASAAGTLQIRELSEDGLISAAADLIADNQVVLWFQGGCELGPRALGHRSILASPSDVPLKDRINRDVKQREWFRPLAPMIVEEEASAYFDAAAPSPFMLIAPRVRPITKELAPGIVHVDGTARLQTVAVDANPRLHALLRRVEARLGVPMLLNTSLNRKDEPIVETPEQAIQALLAMPVEHLVAETLLIQKSPGPPP
jgi:carbamoyltransferase